MGSVIYLTGIPGSGKSSLSRAIVDSNPTPVAVFSYSEQLALELQTSREKLRQQSGEIVAAEAIRTVDGRLADFISAHRAIGPVIIDSHAVTYERYGFRVVPFTPTDLEDLHLDAVVCLSPRSEDVAARITATPDGRPIPDLSAIRQAQRLQETVALSYSLHLGVPIYLVDVAGPFEDCVDRLASVLRRHP